MDDAQRIEQCIRLLRDTMHVITYQLARFAK